MTPRRFLLAALAAPALALAACTDEAPTAPASTPPPQAAQMARGAHGKTIPDRWIVVFDEDVADAPGLARRLTAAHGGTLHHSYRHAIKGFSATLPPAAVEALRRNPQVAYVEADQEMSADQTPVGLDRIDQRDLPLNGSYGYTRTGYGVTAYVIDTGIETSHGEFGGRAWVGYDAFGGSGQDCNGHGTHVAGTIGGATYGVAKAVALVAVRVLDCGGNGSTGLTLAGMDWVRYYHGSPAVVNMSMGGGASQAIDDAVHNLTLAGVTVVVSAGNNSYDACNNSPARAAEAITVGATTAYDAQSSYSNYGSCLDVYAPGDGIRSAWLYGGSNIIDGTSMASPHVAGVAALYLWADPTAAPQRVREAIRQNATMNRLSYLGPGSPNLLVHSNFPSRTYLRIRNRWTSAYIHTEYGLLQAGWANWYWDSSRWVLEAIDGTPYYRFRNKWTGCYIHVEYGYLQCGQTDPWWNSAMWALEPVEGHVRIRNVWTGAYLHVEYGQLQAGWAAWYWHSAMWAFEDTGVPAG
jgi:subtilisin family serine protease